MESDLDPGDTHYVLTHSMCTFPVEDERKKKTFPILRQVFLSFPSSRLLFTIISRVKIAQERNPKWTKVRRGKKFLQASRLRIALHYTVHPWVQRSSGEVSTQIVVRPRLRLPQYSTMPHTYPRLLSTLIFFSPSTLVGLSVKCIAIGNGGILINQVYLTYIRSSAQA